VEYIPREFVKKLNIDRPDEGSQSRLFINSDSSLEDDDLQNFSKPGTVGQINENPIEDLVI
jgi:hypothetical protein